MSYKNKEKQAAYNKEYKILNPNKHRSHDYKNRYGITIEEYDLMLKSQNNVCKICGKSETALTRITKIPRRLAVDHCHYTGKIRGLLCSLCNTGLGKFKNSTKILENAVRYLHNTI